MRPRNVTHSLYVTSDKFLREDCSGGKEIARGKTCQRGDGRFPSIMTLLRSVYDDDSA